MIKYILIATLIIAASCKNRRAAKETGIKAFNTVSLDSLLQKNSFQWQFIEASADVVVASETINQSVNANIKMEKDKIISISARVMGIEGFRIYMQEDSITVINRLGRSYTKIGWQEAGNYIGANLDLSITQNLLLGRLLITNDTNYNMNNEAKTLYWAEILAEKMIYKVHMDSFSHKIDSSFFRGAKTGKHLQLKYSNFNTFADLTLPQNISLKAKDGLSRFNGKINYNSIKTDPFTWSARVPSSFKRQK